MHYILGSIGVAIFCAITATVWSFVCFGVTEVAAAANSKLLHAVAVLLNLLGFAAMAILAGAVGVGNAIITGETLQFVVLPVVSLVTYIIACKFGLAIAKTAMSDVAESCESLLLGLGARFLKKADTKQLTVLKATATPAVLMLEKKDRIHGDGFVMWFKDTTSN